MRVGAETTSSSFCAFLRYGGSVRWPPHKIRERRDALGWTQQQLADVLGVAKRSVVSWERGEAAPRRLATLDAVLGEAHSGAEEPETARSDRTAVELVTALLVKIGELEREAARVTALEREVADLRRQLRMAQLGIEEGPVPDDLWSDPDLVQGPTDTADTHSEDNDGDDQPRRASR